MKKFGFLLLFCMFSFLIPSISHANPALQIYLNGNSLSPTAGGQIMGQTTMVPIRVVSEELGFKVDWNQKSRAITIHSNNRILSLVVNQNAAQVAGKEVSMEKAPTIVKDVTLVPLRFVGEQLGLEVKWENTTKSVYLFTKEVESEPTTDTDVSAESVTGGDSGHTTDPAQGTSSSNDSATPTTATASPSGVAEVQTVSFSDNRLIIGVSQGNLTPSQSVLTNPDRIVVDIPNAKFSSQFFENQVFADNGQSEIVVDNHDFVNKIRFSQFSHNPATIRIVLDLKSPHGYQMTTTHDPNTIVVDLNVTGTDPSEGANASNGTVVSPDVAVNPPTIEAQKPASGKFIFVLDAGHGGKDSGAVGLNNVYEKDYNLAQVLKVAEVFKDDPDVQVILTRSDDTFLELSQRVALAKQYNANLFMSIHANSIAKSTVSGTETYYSRDASLNFAQMVHANLVQGTKLPDRGVRKASLHVTRETTMPAILLESGYVTNTTDVANLFNDDFQYRVAQAIKKGVRQYLGLEP